MEIQSILSAFNNISKKGISEQEIADDISQKLGDNSADITDDVQSEIIGFKLSENYEGREYGWGGYFGPQMVWQTPDGQVTETPSRQLITSEMVQYWGKRAFEVVNPLMKARYAGLFYDFSKRMTGEKPSMDFVAYYIHSLIEVAVGNYEKYPHYTYVKLKRALKLAIKFNKPELVESVKKALQNFENEVGDDDKPGLWGHSYELLIGNKGARLTPEEEQQIIDRLEARLARIEQKAADSYLSTSTALHSVVEYLAEYYNKKVQRSDLLRVINSWANPVLTQLADAHPMQASSWIERLERFYRHYHFKNEADNLLVILRGLGDKVADSLQIISTPFEIPKKEIDQYLNGIFSGSAGDIIGTITSQFIPNKNQTWEEYKKVSNQGVLMNLIPIQIQDERGRVAAVIGPTETDQEGRLVHHMSQSLAFGGFFLNMVLAEGRRRGIITADEVFNFIQSTPIIHEGHKPIVEAAIQAYFADNHLMFIHLMIPQIEEALRNLLEMIGGVVMKHSKDKKSLQLRTLDDLLRDEMLEGILSPDLALYLRVLLTDQRGWNLRNSALHGTMKAARFGQQAADRILHAAMCLGLMVTAMSKEQNHSSTT